jgi:hypothetical protein
MNILVLMVYVNWMNKQINVEVEYVKMDNIKQMKIVFNIKKDV